MSISSILDMEYITGDPLTWSANVRQSLKVVIIDAPESLPTNRVLASDISVDLTGLQFVGTLTLMPKYYEFGGFLQECLNSVKTANGNPVDVSFSLDPIELIRPNSSVLLTVPHYEYRGIPFLVFVTPYEVNQARSALTAFDTNTSDTESYYFAAIVAVAQQAVKALEQKRESYPARVAYPTEDGTQMIVLSALVPTTFLDNFQKGIAQTDTFKVTRTTIMVGDGSSILEFAKVAVASALEPDKADPPIIYGQYRRWAKRSAAKQKKERSTTMLRVA